MPNAQYGDCAVLAVHIAVTKAAPDPKAAWAQATSTAFPHSRSLRDKGCPKGAFLGLCEEGLIKGIPAGIYTKSQYNKQYAIDAVTLLKQQPQLSRDKNALWSALPNRRAVNENNQMDVVLALWNKGLI